MFLSADGIAAISCRHHNGLYIGTRECSGAVGWLRCSNPNERVEPDEVPQDRSPDCSGGQDYRGTGVSYSR